MQLENGFDTIVGGAGGHLSGGERQRISIARAMLKDAPIVILDEATAYTDPENEAILQNSIARLVAGKTLIVIAHRLSTVKDSDQIFVVNDGNIAAHGIHNELLASCPLYKEMWNAHISSKDTVKEETNMFEILAKFFKFSGKENENKFKLSIVIGLVEALASAMKIPAIMYVLIGLMSKESMGKYIIGSIAIMGIAVAVDIICKRFSTVLQTEGGYNASAFMRIKIAEHLRYLPMGYFNSNSIGEISSVTTNTMEVLGDIAARVVMLTTQGILETTMIVLMIFIFDWRIGMISAAGVFIFFVINSIHAKAGKSDSEKKFSAILN